MEGFWNRDKSSRRGKEKTKDIRVIFFGAHQRREEIPEWIEYYENPQRDVIRKLYNEAAIFMGTCYKEGWGLPVSEAMQCGCAVVCTDIDGYNEVAFNENTAMLSEAGKYMEMAENIIELLENREKRYRIALNGNKNIQKYKPEEAFKSFEKFLESIN